MRLLRCFGSCDRDPTNANGVSAEGASEANEPLF
jgi:hypothetical protein